MNIIFFSNSCWSINNFRINLIRSLLKKRYKIIILAPFDGYEKNLIKIGCKVEDIKIQNNSINIFADFFLIINLFFKIFSHRKNSVLLNFTIKPLIFGSFVSGLMKLPTINMITGLGTVFIKDNYLTRLVLILYKIAFKKVNCVLFQNKDDKKIFIKNNIVKEQNTNLVPGSGVDLKKFSYKRLKKKKHTIFLMVARILKEKGILEYIEAAQLLKRENLKIKINLIGSFVKKNKSSLSKDIILRAHKKKIINYLGFIGDIRSEIYKSDCVVLPSYREGTPRFLLEGGAMGRPIITTQAVGCKEVLVNYKNGYFCKIKDYKSLYLKMKKFEKLKFNKKNKMSLYSRNFISHKFDEKKVIDTYLNLIKRLKNETK